MARGNLFAQTTGEAPAALMDKTFIAPTLLPVCCVCKLIRDKTGPSPDRERWITLRAYQKTHGLNPTHVPLTHTYCPNCFTQAMGTVRRSLGESCRFSPISEPQHRAKGEIMTSQPTELISRIQWCRLQQLHSVTPDERAGWRAEEAGLVDALGSRDRIDFMRKEYRSQFTRYRCGLEDGQAILRLSTSTPCDKTRMEGESSDTLTTQVNRRRSQAPRPMYDAFQR